MKVDFQGGLSQLACPQWHQDNQGTRVRANGSEPLGSEGGQLAAKLTPPVFQVAASTALGRLKVDTGLRCSRVTPEFVNMI